MATRIRRYCGPIFLEFDGKYIREYCGPIRYEYDGKYIREYCGPVRYEIDGFLGDGQVAAILCLLFA